MTNLTTAASDFWIWIGQNKDSVGAIIGAVGIPVLLFQITQADRQERKRLARRHSAARATLPLTLAGLCDYAQQVTEALFGCYTYLKGRAEDWPGFHNPPTPDTLIAALERMIEAAQSDRIADRLADTLGLVQVLHSRLSELDGNARTYRLSVDEFLLECAEIYAMACSLFGFARRDTDAPPPPMDKEQIANALHSLGIMSSSYPDVHSALARDARWMPIGRIETLRRMFRYRFAHRVLTDC